ncbi:SDR family oxidoreductase [Epibacterium sp. DP7N7-1]|uniref:SDR family oxidoreductase n=1 Tax=Tritonibacter mobilis TaxID=379347 RepID=UPI0001B8A83A|nr:SDR family oxidoreductase [Tritonibacter mobilis]EEW60608.1 ribitol 2-dehydrogenase [Ruegeria sp. TrichCH4B]MBW3245035.1 SDR family oxidoreductase [Epibacterium sp. DP7N7-1]MEE2811123.1 SDR family oxidoreductase [Pseudomonadota bacterium]NKX36694.1 SDR family oxidoreductase [Rhodobacteraceae bacterium R_SAG4]MBU3033879.1 SDR family oxidoreductase [Tritonibacter mobilis]
MSQSLKGKVAVVTGAASGIGLAAVEMLLRNDCKVVMVDRNAAALADLVAKYGDHAVAQVTDLLDVDSCNAMVPEILAKVGQIDILYCNAGAYIGGDLWQSDPAAIDRMLNLNVNAVMKNIQAVLPHMMQRKSGDIVVTNSIAGHYPAYWEPVYSGSKWAITSFMQGIRRQMIPYGVKVAQVSPGPVVSALLADWPEENLRKAKEAGALMDPEEVADALEFMLTRKRQVTVRDVIVMPTAFERM